MSDFSDLVRSMKKAAKEAVEAGSPVQVNKGNVISTAPLRIQIDQKLILEASQILLTRSVIDTELELKCTCPEGGPPTGKVPYALKAGDTVLLLQVQGGNEYAVIDKVVTAS